MNKGCKCDWDEFCWSLEQNWLGMSRQQKDRELELKHVLDRMDFDRVSACWLHYVGQENPRKGVHNGT